jgi:hypothetical protein
LILDELARRSSGSQLRAGWFEGRDRRSLEIIVKVDVEWGLRAESGAYYGSVFGAVH